MGRPYFGPEIGAISLIAVPTYLFGLLISCYVRTQNSFKNLRGLVLHGRRERGHCVFSKKLKHLMGRHYFSPEVGTISLTAVPMHLFGLLISYYVRTQNSFKNLRGQKSNENKCKVGEAIHEIDDVSTSSAENK